MKCASNAANYVTVRMHPSKQQLNAALAGFGIALLPTLMTRPHLESGHLLRVLPGYGLHGVGVYFVYLSRRELPRAVNAFMDFNVPQIRERVRGDPRPLPRTKGRRKARRRAQ